jgi:hypothetical protein
MPTHVYDISGSRLSVRQFADAPVEDFISTLCSNCSPHGYRTGIKLSICKSQTSKGKTVPTVAIKRANGLASQSGRYLKGK